MCIDTYVHTYVHTYIHTYIPYLNTIYLVKLLLQGVDSPTELGQRDIVAFSYFFDRALEAGLVGDSGGYVAVNQFKKVGDNKYKR